MGAIKSAGFIVILCATYLFAGKNGIGIQPTEYNLICKGKMLNLIIEIIEIQMNIVEA